MLDCSCDISYSDWYYLPPTDFESLDRKRRVRCYSCEQLIDLNADCLRFERFRDPVNEIEERICGDEVMLADKFVCRQCGEIFLNLTSIGYCLMLGYDFRDYLEDYWDITGFKPEVT